MEELLNQVEVFKELGQSGTMIVGIAYITQQVKKIIKPRVKGTIYQKMIFLLPIALASVVGMYDHGTMQEAIRYGIEYGFGANGVYAIYDGLKSSNKEEEQDG